MADIGDGGLLSGLEQNGLSPCYREDNFSWIGLTCGYSVVVQVDSATKVVNATGFYPSVPISLGEIIEKYGEPAGRIF